MLFRVCLPVQYWIMGWYQIHDVFKALKGCAVNVWHLGGQGLQLCTRACVDASYTSVLMFDPPHSRPSSAHPTAIRSIAVSPVDAFSTTGLWWCTDLSAPDPLFILPVSLAALNLTSIQLNRLSQQPPKRIKSPEELEHEAQHGAPAASRPPAIAMTLGIAIGMLGCTLPSGLVLYWWCNSICTITQTLLFRHPAPRRFLGIPQSQSETTQPILRATQNMRAAVIEWWRRPPEK
eukprot:m.213199 g.213199  ORF g.213199 m.213199 type:complete len:234 (-) comp15082_c3_seq1:154-855(-)